MKKNLTEKIKESLASVLPVAAVVFLLMISIVPISGELFFMFFVGTVLLVVGIGLFTLGADTSMIIIGEQIGAKLVKMRKIWLILPVCFLIGVLPFLLKKGKSIIWLSTSILQPAGMPLAEANCDPLCFQLIA